MREFNFYGRFINIARKEVPHKCELPSHDFMSEFKLLPGTVFKCLMNKSTPIPYSGVAESPCQRSWKWTVDKLAPEGQWVQIA